MKKFKQDMKLNKMFEAVLRSANDTMQEKVQSDKEWESAKEFFAEGELDIKNIKALESAYLESIHSFARSQAIGFNEYLRSDDCDYWYDRDDKVYRGRYANIMATTKEMYSQFLAHQAKQKEGGNV